jgi:hypothetical protein
VGRALGHLQVEVDPVGFDDGEHDEADVARPEQRENQQSHPDEGGQRQVAQAHRALQHRRIDLADKCVQTLRDVALHAVEAAHLVWRLDAQVGLGQVGGQNELGLDQREDQAKDHHPGDVGEARAAGAGIIRIGMNAAIVVSTPKVTGTATSCAPG